MKKRDSWDSEFRKKRFYENREKKAFKKYLMQMGEYNPNRILKSKPAIVPKSIAIMLDLDGTSNRIDASSAEIFMNQVDALRKQFGEEKAYICISTHDRGCERIKMVMDELNAFPRDGVILSRSFYFGGYYDYDTNSDFYKGAPFNMDKIETFTKIYVNNRDINIGWFALIDDGISEDVFKNYQYEMPMVVLRPGQHYTSKYNNFMYRETCTDNFDGVVELMDGYIKDIEGMTRFDILDKQESMIRHLSDHEIRELIQERRFGELLVYLKSDKTDKDDYRSTYTWLMMEAKLHPIGAYYQTVIEEILEVLREHEVFLDTVEKQKALIITNEDM